MKTYVFIVLRKHGKYLLERRGPFLGFHDVEVKEGETIIDATRRGCDEVALAYNPSFTIEEIRGKFFFRGQWIEAVFVTVNCINPVSRSTASVSFDFDLAQSILDETCVFFRENHGKPAVCAA